MTERVDFYILASSTAKHRWTFACRLVEKAYLQDLKVVVVSDSATDLELLDELLWTFNERSFVPHDIVRAESPHESPEAPVADAAVRLTPDLAAIGATDLLVNLRDDVPPNLERFARIAEIVDADGERRRLGRERFKAYRDLKLPLETHRMDDDADV